MESLHGSRGSQDSEPATSEVSGLIFTCDSDCNRVPEANWDSRVSHQPLGSGATISHNCDFFLSRDSVDSPVLEEFLLHVEEARDMF